jgi:hypothetical protein
MSKTIKLYKLIQDVYNSLEYLVEPTVSVDIREERGKLLEAMEILENE